MAAFLGGPGNQWLLNLQILSVCVKEKVLCAFMRVPLNVLALVQTKLTVLVDSRGDNVTLMTSDKHIHMDTTSAAAIETPKRRAPLDSSSYYNLFHGFLSPCVFPLFRALLQEWTRQLHWCHLVLSQIFRGNPCRLWTVVKIPLSKRGMWLTSDGVTDSKFGFLSFVRSKMLAGLDWDI